LHWAPAATSCPSPSTIAGVDACFNTLRDVGLPTQRSWTASVINDINAAADRVKLLGLGSINTYLHKLGSPIKSHPVSGSLLQDLHGSEAEFAFNFGILEDILNRDEKAFFASKTCFEFPPWASATSEANWMSAVNSFINPPRANNLCELYLDMQSSRYPGGALPQGDGVRKNMFRYFGQMGSAC